MMAYLALDLRTQFQASVQGGEPAGGTGTRQAHRRPQCLVASEVVVSDTGGGEGGGSKGVEGGVATSGGMM